MKWHVTKIEWVDVSEPWLCFVFGFQTKDDFHAYFCVAYYSDIMYYDIDQTGIVKLQWQCQIKPLIL